MGFRRRIKREDGAAAVEFAIIAILLFGILFAIIDFGLVLHRYQVYEGAAREGARYAAVRCVSDTHPTPGCSASDISTRVNDAAAGWDIGPGTPTADKVCDDSTVGQEVTVSWDQKLQLVDLPFVPPITSNVTIKGVFRCE